MYYIKKISIFLKNIIFNYFYWSGSRYPRVIEYQDEYLKSEYPKTMNPDPNIKFTNPTDPDPNTLNFPDIRIRVPWIFRISGSVPGLPKQFITFKLTRLLSKVFCWLCERQLQNKSSQDIGQFGQRWWMRRRNIWNFSFRFVRFLCDMYYLV